MKSAYSFSCLVLAALLTGCATSTVKTDLDLTLPWEVAILHGSDELQPDLEDNNVIEGILKYGLPRMRSTISTYPTPLYRIRVVEGFTAEDSIDRIVFVGSNWIGDGRGIATLADTQAFRLRRIIDKTIANKAELVPDEHGTGELSDDS